MPELDAVATLVAQARAEWPGIEVRPELFGAYLRERASEDLDSAQLRVADLYLACACAHGVAAAHKAFERCCIAPIDRVLSHMRLPANTVDEIKQIVRAKLLLGEGGTEPRIAEYLGRGDLRSWVGVVATREALSLLRRRGKPEADDDALMRIESAHAGPELGYLKEHYREQFRTAFLTALADLGPEARNALRHHYVHGLTIDELGAMYGVHRSNAARRIAKARDSLLSGTRRRLVHGLRVDRQEFESIMRMIESRLDLSIQSLLGD